MKRKKKEKDKPGAQSPALKTTSIIIIEVFSGSSINEDAINEDATMEIKIIVYFHRQGFTRLESFVYHDECTNPEALTTGVLDKSVCFVSYICCM